DALDDAEQVKGAAREAVNARHRHHVAEGQLAEHPVKLAPVGPRAGRLLAVDVAAAASGGAKLLKLAVEALPHGTDAGIADKPFFGVSFDLGARFLSKFLISATRRGQRRETCFLKKRGCCHSSQSRTVNWEAADYV